MNTIAKKSAALAAAAAIGFGLSGCVSDGPKEQGGAVIGAVLGGVLGSSIGGNVGTRIAGGIAGSLIGGFIGASIGAQLDAADRQALAEMTYVSASQNRPREYYNRSTGVRIKTRPIKTTRVTWAEFDVLPDEEKSKWADPVELGEAFGPIF